MFSCFRKKKKGKKKENNESKVEEIAIDNGDESENDIIVVNHRQKKLAEEEGIKVKALLDVLGVKIKEGPISKEEACELIKQKLTDSLGNGSEGLFSSLIEWGRILKCYELDSWRDVRDIYLENIGFIASVNTSGNKSSGVTDHELVVDTAFLGRAELFLDKNIHHDAFSDFSTINGFTDIDF